MRPAPPAPPVVPAATPTEPVATLTEPIATPTEPVATLTEPLATPTEPVATLTEPLATPTEPLAALHDGAAAGIDPGGVSPGAETSAEKVESADKQSAVSPLDVSAHETTTAAAVAANETTTAATVPANETTTAAAVAVAGSFRPKKMRVLPRIGTQHHQRMKKCGSCAGCLSPNCLRFVLYLSFRFVFPFLSPIFFFFSCQFKKLV